MGPGSTYANVVTGLFCLKGNRSQSALAGEQETVFDCSLGSEILESLGL